MAVPIVLPAKEIVESPQAAVLIIRKRDVFRLLPYATFVLVRTMKNYPLAFVAIAIAAPLLILPASAQSLNQNLVANGSAEAGAASDSGPTPTPNIPGWTRNGNADVILWNQNGDLSSSDRGPLDRGAKYFTGGPSNANSSLSQTIDLSALGSIIDGANITFDLSAYLGGYGTDLDSATLAATFQSSTGQVLKTVTLGPLPSQDGTYSEGLYFLRQIGFVPVNTRRVNLVLTFNRVNGSYNDGGADNVSLILRAPASADSLIGSNLIQNASAEDGTATNGEMDYVVEVPRWVRTGDLDVETYALNGADFANGQLPPTPGANYFTGGNPIGTTISTGTQDIDVSGAATRIDTNSLSYTLSGYLGGYSNQNDNTVLTAEFRDKDFNVLSTNSIGPVTAANRNNITTFLSRTVSGALPSGTRFIRIILKMTRTDGNYNDGYADKLSFVINGVSAPPSIGAAISLSGFGGLSGFAPNSLIEIYGTNLSPVTRGWTGADFVNNTAPTSLGGVSVTIAGKPAFVNYVSATQVNVVVPDGIGTGSVPVVVSTPAGISNPFNATAFATRPAVLALPSFVIGGKQYAGALFNDFRTVAMPSGAVAGVPSRPAVPGDVLVLYGIGFGAVNPTTPAGLLAPGTSQLASNVQVKINGVNATVQFAGLAPGYAGLYQLNITVPNNVGTSDAAPLEISQGGTAIGQTLYTAVRQQ